MGIQRGGNGTQIISGAFARTLVESRDIDWQSKRNGGVCFRRLDLNLHQKTRGRITRYIISKLVLVLNINSLNEGQHFSLPFVLCTMTIRGLNDDTGVIRLKA